MPALPVSSILCKVVTPGPCLLAQYKVDQSVCLISLPYGQAHQASLLKQAGSKKYVRHVLAHIAMLMRLIHQNIICNTVCRPCELWCGKMFPDAETHVAGGLT